MKSYLHAIKYFEPPKNYFYSSFLFCCYFFRKLSGKNFIPGLLLKKLKNLVQLFEFFVR